MWEMCSNNIRNVLKEKFMVVDKYEEFMCVFRCGENVYYIWSNWCFVESWIIVWFVLCFIFIGLIVLIFVIDILRFKYFEWFIIFLFLCYNFYFIGYIVCVIVGMEKIICDKMK